MFNQYSYTGYITNHLTMLQKQQKTLVSQPLFQCHS